MASQVCLTDSHLCEFDAATDVAHPIVILASQRQGMMGKMSAPKESKICTYASAAEKRCQSAAYPGHGDARCLQRAALHEAAHTLWPRLAPCDTGPAAR